MINARVTPKVIVNSQNNVKFYLILFNYINFYSCMLEVKSMRVRSPCAKNDDRFFFSLLMSEESGVISVST